MSDCKSSIFIASHTYNFSFETQEVFDCSENNALWGPIVKFGSYGPWLLSFYPNGYHSSVPAKFAIILSSAYAKDHLVPTCLAKAVLIFANGGDPNQTKTLKFSNRSHHISKINPIIGCGWYQQELLETIPEIKSWKSVHLTMRCYFTEIASEVIDEENWKTFRFLKSNAVSCCSDYFFHLDLANQELVKKNVDCKIKYPVKQLFSNEPKEASLSMHKAVLIKQSPKFEKLFDENTDGVIYFPGFSDKIVKDVILFCYKNELNSYTDQHIAFATNYEMKDLLRKADEYLSAASKKSNLKEMMKLTEKYCLPELTKNCFYISENANKPGSLKKFFVLVVQSFTSFFRRLFGFSKKL